MRWNLVRNALIVLEIQSKNLHISALKGVEMRWHLVRNALFFLKIQSKKFTY